MGRSVGYGHQCDYEECDYRQECLLWAGVSGMGRSVITGRSLVILKNVIMGRSVGYGQERCCGQEGSAWAEVWV